MLEDDKMVATVLIAAGLTQTDPDWLLTPKTIAERSLDIVEAIEEALKKTEE